MALHTLWRLTKRSYADSAFSGEGARLYGGRFNPPGHRAVYTAESLALATLETLTTLPAYRHLEQYVFFRLDLPDDADNDLIRWLDPSSLPSGWDARPPGATSQRIGREWLKDEDALALVVPSVVVPYSWNVVLNPAHPAMDDVRIHEHERFPVDERLG